VARTVTINEVDYEEVELHCVEPGCDGRLRLRPSRYGVFYGCCNWKLTSCPGGHSAHQNTGHPMGKPIPSKDKGARKAAHAVFDQLWKSKRMSRGAAYHWMQKALGMTAKQAHIGNFDKADCKRLVLAFRDDFPELWKESWGAR
jgi:hypothetical protein